MKLQKIKPLFEFFNEQMPEVFVTNFADYLTLPKRMGLYSIWQDDRCIYVAREKYPIGLSTIGIKQMKFGSLAKEPEMVRRIHWDGRILDHKIGLIQKFGLLSTF